MRNGCHIGARENHVVFIGFIRTESIVGIVVALVDIGTAPVLVATELDFSRNISCTAKIRKGPVFTISFTRRALFAVSTEISILAFAGSLGFAQGHACPTYAVNVHLRTRATVTAFSQPAIFAYACLVGNLQCSSEVSRGTGSVFTAQRIGTNIDLTIGSDESSSAFAGLGTAIAIRVRVASSLAFFGTLSRLDDSRKPFPEVNLGQNSIAAVDYKIAVDGIFIRGLLLGAGPNTSTVSGPRFIVEKPIVASPYELSVVLAADQAIVTTFPSSNIQDQFVFRPTVANDWITEFNYPILG